MYLSWPALHQVSHLGGGAALLVGPRAGGRPEPAGRSSPPRWPVRAWDGSLMTTVMVWLPSWVWSVCFSAVSAADWGRHGLVTDPDTVYRHRLVTDPEQIIPVQTGHGPRTRYTDWSQTRTRYTDTDWSQTRTRYTDTDWSQIRTRYTDTDWSQTRTRYTDTDWSRAPDTLYRHRLVTGPKLVILAHVALKMNATNINHVSVASVRHISRILTFLHCLREHW